MKAEDLLELIGEADEELIAQAGEKEIVKARGQRKWIPFAACLCLLLAVGALWGARRNRTAPAPIGDTVPQTTVLSLSEFGSLNARDAASLFPSSAESERNDGETRAYREIYRPSGYNPGGELPKVSQALPVYTVRSGMTVDVQAAKDFYSRYLSAMKQLVDLTGQDSEPEERTDAYGNTILTCQVFEEHIPADGEGDEAYSLRSVNYTAGRNEYRIQATDSDPMEINGEITRIPCGASEEEIAALLGSVVSYVNELLGTDCRDMKIVRDWGRDGEKTVSVYLYSGKTEALPETPEAAPLAQECICLQFHSDWGEGIAHDFGVEDDYAYLDDVSYTRAEGSWDAYYEILCAPRMLSLEEAEGKLKAGHVFGMHACPLCMREQDAVDFSEYDAVSFAYVSDPGGLSVPFYIFYRDLGEDGGMERYAETYVCAVELENEDAYFESLQSEHPAP